MLTLASAAASAPPAGGAAIGQVIIATVGAMVVTGGLLVLGRGHRNGRLPILTRLGELAERQSGLPGWAALPAAIITVSLIVALFGMLWDISIHIDEGRDEGPLANPAHYFILAGLFGVFSAGYVAMVLPMGSDRPGRTAIRIAEGWYAPLGGVLIAACGAFSLVGFPLDDVWHRLFGQDVTLWGPTHLMLIGGASMTLVGLAVLLVEGGRANTAMGRPEGGTNWARWVRQVSLTGALLLGLSTFQAEFDFGVPQFRFVFAPMLVMLAGGVALVAARVWLGRGAALGAAVFFLAIRGAIAVIVGPILGESTPHFPLYLPEALLVEAAAFVVSARRPLPFGIVSGALIGTVGLAAEWGWSHVFMPIPWPQALFPEGAVLGLAMAISGSLVGAWMGARLASDRLPRTVSLRAAACLGALAIAGLVGYALYKPADEGIRGTLSIDRVGNGEGVVGVQLDPPSAADDPEWFQVTSWQGGGLDLEDMEPTGSPGGYTSAGPVPLTGDWKTLVRLHEGNSLDAIPVYLPRDPAIPVRGVPATDGATRTFVADHEILQREQKTAAGWLWGVAYAVVLAITLGFLALLTWGLHRLALAAEPAPRPARAEADRGVAIRRPAPIAR